MKVLSVKQPWATLIAMGWKTIEVRSWATNYRGEILICASASPKNVFLWNEKMEQPVLQPAGCMVGVVDLADCRPMLKTDEDDALCDYSKGAWSWVLDNPQFCRPDSITGRLGLWSLPDTTTVWLLERNEEFFDYEPAQGNITFNPKKHVCLGEPAAKKTGNGIHGPPDVVAL